MPQKPSLAADRTDLDAPITLVTDDMIRSMPCNKCNAAPGQSCSSSILSSVGLTTFHKERRELAISRANELTSTDKALITYYAFVSLCNSCSVKSERLFGKQFSTEEIQRTFAKQALEALRRDGLIR